MNDTSRFKREASALRANIKRRNMQQKLRRDNVKALSQEENHCFTKLDSELKKEHDMLVVTGKDKFNGKVKISGAKNAALPLIFATLLSDKKTKLHNVPCLSDINISNDILRELNVEVHFNNNTLTVDPSSINNFTASQHLVSQMRASILVLGPLLAKYQFAKIALPGGCLIGKRPIDIHLKCMQQLGAEIIEDGNFIIAQSKGRLKGARIEMEKASVGATENLIMAASLAEGTTTVINPAKEPEIIDLIEMLNQMGAKITGAGTDKLVIDGVETLNGANHTVCGDRIEAGSYAVAAAISCGEVTLENIEIKYLENILTYLKKAGVEVEVLSETSVTIKGNGDIKPVDIVTGPYPDFPTDLQPQWVTLMTQANGTSKVTESIFENRLGYIKELQKMGANITINNPHEATIIGQVDTLKGMVVTPTDLRASFAFILAGIIAKGSTTLDRLDFLDRGYENIVEKLINCGVNVTRITPKVKEILSNVSVNNVDANS